MPESKDALPLQDLAGLLSQTLGGPVSVQVTGWKHLTDPGENFGSLILAINADVTKDGQQESLNLVCKMPPKSAYLLELFNAPMAFKKEIYFYTSIAPAFLELQVSSGIAESELIKLVPRFYGGRMSLSGVEGKFDEQAAILLENLVYSGYTTKDRIAGMDLEHMEYGVRELAKLHAISCGYRLKDPAGFERIVAPGLVLAANETAVQCTAEMVQKALENLRNMSQAQPHMERVFRTLEHCENEMAQPKPLIERWRTFVHHDFWVNNMMFRYSNSGKILGMKIVDFQLSMADYGMKDLIFFIVSSATKEIIDTKLEDLLSLYYESFIETLRALKCDTSGYSREEFNRLLKESAPLKFPQCIMMVQVIKATRGSAPDVNSIKNSEAFLSIGKGKIYEDKLLHVLQTFLKHGWLLD